MPRAAIPNYMGEQLDDASPGLRFGFYLPIWVTRQDQESEVKERGSRRSREAQTIRRRIQDSGLDGAIEGLVAEAKLARVWEKASAASSDAWKSILALTRDDHERMEALGTRQDHLAALIAGSGQVFTIDAKGIAPFTTGLGNEHPLENGFSFLDPYGLPYLAGSGVKGVLRSAARELAGISTRARWDIESEWTREAIDVLFGPEISPGEDSEEHNAQRGALSFWDVVPQLPRGADLAVEVMTPHMTHYLQPKGNEAPQSPHESGTPNPIKFLTIPPGADFTFHVVCDLPFLQRREPGLAQDGRWKKLLQQAFEHAFEWLGFGAKTAVGYGAMEHNVERDKQRREEAERAREERQRDREREELRELLPEDAFWVVEHESEWGGHDNTPFLDAVEGFMKEREGLSNEAFEKLKEQMEQRWPKIMSDPDAVRGKKKQPKYKSRPRDLAKKLLAVPKG